MKFSRRLLTAVMLIGLGTAEAATVQQMQVPGLMPVIGTVGVGGPVRYLLAANHGQFNTTTFQATAANHVRAETRTRHKTGNARYSELRLIYSGFYLANGTGVTTSVGNNVAVQAAIEWPGAPTVTVQVTFDGSGDGVIVNGVARYMSDPVYPAQFGLSYFPENTTFWVRRLSSVANLERYGRHESSAAANERTAFSDGQSASQLLGSGAMVVPPGGADASAIMGPNAIIGRAIGPPDISVGLIGDSIITGSNDTSIGSDGEAGGGYGSRGLWSVNSRSIPNMKMSVGGLRLSNLVAATAWIEYLPYLTHCYVAGGTNDMAVGGNTGATAWASAQQAHSACKLGGVRRVEQAMITPRTTSTDSWATVVNQTPATEFATGGQRRSAFNALNVAGGSLDASFDPNVQAADGTSTDRWVAGGTADGVHPTTAIHTSIGTAFATRAGTWR